jgi:WD40 repeat protein
VLADRTDWVMAVAISADAKRALTGALDGTLRLLDLESGKSQHVFAGRADIDYSDIPPLGNEFFTKATEAWPPAKQELTIRLDADVLKWLKAHGRGYPPRINHILRAAMESHPTRRTRSTLRPPKKNTRSRSGLKPA